MSKKTKKGQFKTKMKFIEFIGGKGNINFISNEATIDGTQLSGLDMDGIKFKIMIYKDNSVDIDEIDTNITTKSQRGRLLEIIEDKTVSSYRGRSVIHELDFISTTQVKDKFIPLYLAVEIEKPINILSDLLQDSIKATDSALNNLDDLINSWLDDEDFQKMIHETTESIVDVIMQDHDNNIDIKSEMESQFQNMKKEKLAELKSNKEKKEKELSSLNFQLSTISKNIETVQSEIELLNDRIDNLQPFDEPTGFMFFVSERQNEVVSLDASTEKIIKDKISKIKSINVDNFMKLFTDGEFHIKFGTKPDETIDNLELLPDHILEKLGQLNLVWEENGFVYRGELSWSQIVNILIKLGFEENSEFNKFCGSNSYQSSSETKDQIKNTKTTY